MPTLTFNLSADASSDLVDALCWQHGYQTVLDGGGPNPEPRAVFARRQIALYLRDTVRKYREELAKQAAAAATNPDIT